jgi:hypothetical protein
VLRDLTPVTQLISVPNVLVVHPAQPMKILADYIAAAKAAPGKITYGSAGVGSNLHLALELLKYRTGIDVTHVPYKGVGPALQDTLAGHVMSMISNIPSSEPHIDKGSLRALAVTSAKRSSALPDVPTMSEAGVKDYEVLNWFGMFAPAGTPPAIVERLAAEAAAMFADPKTQEMLTAEGADPVGSKPADFAKFVRAEIAKWDELGKAVHLQPEWLTRGPELFSDGEERCGLGRRHRLAEQEALALLAALLQQRVALLAPFDAFRRDVKPRPLPRPVKARTMAALSASEPMARMKLRSILILSSLKFRK